MTKSVGSIVRNAREKKSLTRDRAARLLKLSAGYLGQIERDAPIPISERIVEAIAKKLGPRLKPEMVERHNKRSAKVYKRYRANAAAKAH